MQSVSEKDRIMAKKYYSEEMPKGGSNSPVFDMNDKRTVVGEMPNGSKSVPSYDTGLQYSDLQVNKNSSYKKNTKN